MGTLPLTPDQRGRVEAAILAVPLGKLIEGWQRNGVSFDESVKMLRARLVVEVMRNLSAMEREQD